MSGRGLSKLVPSTPQEEYSNPQGSLGTYQGFIWYYAYLPQEIWVPTQTVRMTAELRWSAVHYNPIFYTIFQGKLKIMQFYQSGRRSS